MFIGVLTNFFTKNKIYIKPKIIADIGGTNARFAIKIGMKNIKKIFLYSCKKYINIIDIIKKYLKKLKKNTIINFNIAIANPIYNKNYIKMTNNNWKFSIKIIKYIFSIKSFIIINDFIAIAISIYNLKNYKYTKVNNKNNNNKHKITTLLGPGTGLGVSAIIKKKEIIKTINSEAGHITYFPNKNIENNILKFSKKKWTHTSFERILSGYGIFIIYYSISKYRNKYIHRNIKIPKIIQNGINGNSLESELINIFFDMLGIFSGNIVITFYSLKSIFICGGIIPKLKNRFLLSNFKKKFENKGRLKLSLTYIPIYLITTKYPSFYRHLNKFQA